MKFCYTTYAIGKDSDLDECIQLAHAGGCAGIEFRINDLDSDSPGHRHGIQLGISADERQRILRRMEDEYLEVAQICTGFRFEYSDKSLRQKHVEGSKQAVDLAADLHAPFIRVFGNVVPDGVAAAECVTWVGDALAQVADYAAAKGVVVLLEMHGQFNFWGYALDALKQADRENLGILYNCDKRDLVGGSVRATYERVAKHIRHVHLHNFEDDYPYGELFALLERDGYTGYVSAEIQPSSDPVRVMALTGTVYRAYQRPLRRFRG